MRRTSLLPVSCILVLSGVLLLTGPLGAEDYRATRDHWAFRPMQEARPPLPPSDWPLTPVDSFLEAAAQAIGVSRAREADTPTLLRRLYYVLTGLPPTPAEVDRFVSDPRPDRWERLVDRLLASPRFGERWGRHWLDVARYADSTGGGRSLIFSESWRYRDYVLDAFNRDMPFDKFVQEQVAGDLLPSETPEERRQRLIATGFLVIGPNNYETQNKRLLDYDIADEQIETIGRAFLGISLGCARCHDHKFDPVATREYYGLAGIFLNTRSVVHDNVSRWYEVELPPTPEVAAKREAALHRVRELEKQVDALRAQLAAFDGTYTNQPTDPSSLRGVVIEAESAASTGEWASSDYSPRRIGEAYLHDKNQGKGEKTLTFRWKAPAQGKYLLRLAYAHGGNRPANVPVQVRAGNSVRNLTVDETKVPPEGVFVRLGEFELAAGDELVVTISNEGTKGHVVVDAIQILTAEEARERQEIARTVENQAKELERIKGAVPPLEVAMGVQDRPPGEIQDSPVLIRGQLEAKGPVVRRSVPTFLGEFVEDRPIPDGTSGRLELARWLTDPRSPLTWRVYVNRVWHYTFGHGLVRTTDNFGTTGEPPSHPELLDFLALRFQKNGASTKRLVRDLVCSRAFRLSSGDATLAEQVDPDNRLFMRFSKRRLEAEELRDTLLWVAGTLDTSMGGPSIPAELRKKGVEEKQVRSLPFTRKRSVYQPLLRNLAPEYYALFDGANTSFVCGRRFESVTSLQALYLMNDDFVLEQAEATAERLLASVQDDRSRVVLAFRSVLCRKPTDQEVELCLTYLNERLDTGAAPQEAWTELVHALFCTAEFRYVY